MIRRRSFGYKFVKIHVPQSREFLDQVNNCTGNICYHSVQNLLSSRLLSKNIKIRIYNTIILPVVLYGSETLSLTLREEHRLRMFENRVLRRIRVF
jgi:hypothetical protein